MGQGNAHRPIVDTTPVLLELGYKQFEIEANGAHAGPERFETAVGDAEPEKAQRTRLRIQDICVHSSMRARRTVARWSRELSAKGVRGRASDRRALGFVSG